jgi:hypothetical protein
MLTLRRHALAAQVRLAGALGPLPYGRRRVR